MNIRIEDLASTDFSDVADLSAGKLPTTHPGEHLSEILGELGVSQAEFARAIGVSHVVKGTRPVTAELALLFGRAFDQSPQYWMNLQAGFDLKIAGARIGERLTAVHEFAHA